MCRDSQGRLVEYKSLKTNTFPIDRLYSPLKDLIDSRRSSGRFLFDESFVGAKEYIDEYPIVVDLLRKRFKYVFLDEAQDCSELQLEILERLFSDSDSVLFQQIGDENQEITDDKWSPGDASLTLSESVRFGEDISGFINKFKISGDTDVVGVGLYNTEKVLITYSDDRKNDVLSKYASLIIEKEIPVTEEEGFYCIASEHKILEGFHSSYSRDLSSVKKNSSSFSFKNDNDYIKLLNKDYLTKYGHNHIFNILFSLLYKYYREDGEWYELRKTIREGENNQAFKELITRIATDVKQNIFIVDAGYVSESLNAILGENKINFTNQDNQEVDAFSKRNIFQVDGVKINLGTIHSVKGQTHNATLHLSDFKKFGRGELKSDFEWSLGNTPTSLRYKRHIYVAASRPKNLFISAVHADLYERVKDEGLFNDFEHIDLC
jgi:superfamily I DNA/RNA helicase